MSARRWFAASVTLTALVGACSQNVTTATSATATGSGGASTGSTGSAATATTGSGGASTGSTGTGMTTGACGALTCTATQLCVRPACTDVQGEICIFQQPDAGQICPEGTARGEQFDSVCVQPGYACVSGCPPEPPFCVDLPAGCGGVASCGCLAMDPCLPSNSGACHDKDISSGVLTCSLMP